MYLFTVLTDSGVMCKKAHRAQKPQLCYVFFMSMSKISHFEDRILPYHLSLFLHVTPAIVIGLNYNHRLGCVPFSIFGPNLGNLKWVKLSKKNVMSVKSPYYCELEAI